FGMMVTPGMDVSGFVSGMVGLGTRGPLGTTGGLGGTWGGSMRAKGVPGTGTMGAPPRVPSGAVGFAAGVAAGIGAGVDAGFGAVFGAGVDAPGLPSGGTTTLPLLTSWRP